MGGAELGKESITAAGLEDLAEVEQLEGPTRREIAERIRTARELGDLKENADYHIAKEDQAHLETKIKRLRARLRDAEVVEVGGDADAFAFGRTAEVVDEASGKIHTWTLVGSTEAEHAPDACRPNRRSGTRCATARWASRSSRRRAATAPFTIQKLVGQASVTNQPASA